MVCHVHDSEIERGLGASYEAWLSSLAARLEAGRLDENYGLSVFITTTKMSIAPTTPTAAASRR